MDFGVRFTWIRILPFIGQLCPWASLLTVLMSQFPYKLEIMMFLLRVVLRIRDDSCQKACTA